MITPHRMAQRMQIHALWDRIQVLAGFEKAANLAWGRILASNAEPMFKMFDCLLNLSEIIGCDQHLPRYSCLIGGQYNVETYTPPDMLARAAHAGQEACKLLDHALPRLDLVTRPADGSGKAEVDLSYIPLRQTQELA
jgi:hypothetical protein